MPRIQEIRSEVLRHIRAVPFQPFALNMENGDRVLIEHPENIAFDPENETNGKGSSDFYAFSGSLRVCDTFDSVTSIARADRGENGA